MADNASTAAYELILEEVADVSAVRSTPLLWNYAELTEVHITNAPTGHRVEVAIWGDSDGIDVRCGRVRQRDAAEVTGRAA